MRRLATWYLLRGYATDDPLRAELHDLRLRAQTADRRYRHEHCERIKAECRAIACARLFHAKQ